MHREQRAMIFFFPAKETKGSSSVLRVFSCGCAVSRVVVDHTVLFFPWRGQSTGTAGLKEKMLVFWAQLCLLILSPPSRGSFFFFFFDRYFSNLLLGSVIACRTQVGSNDATRQTCFFFLVKAPLLRSEALIRLLLKTSTQLHVHYVSHSAKFLSFFHFVTEWKFSPQGRVNAILKRSHPFEEWCCTLAFSWEKAPAHPLLKKKKKKRSIIQSSVVVFLGNTVQLVCHAWVTPLSSNSTSVWEQESKTRTQG